MAFERIDDVHGGDGLPLRVLAVGDSVADDVLQEHLQNASCLLIDESGDALHASSARQSTDGGFRDSLDVVSEHLAMTFGASLSKPFTSFATTRHLDF